MALLRFLSALPLLTVLVVGCGSAEPEEDGVPAANTLASAAKPGAAENTDDREGDDCLARVKAMEGASALAGAPLFEANRISILGRARTEPVVFVRPPKPVDKAALPEAARTSFETFEKAKPYGRVSALAKRHKTEKATLRTLLLREAYTYAEDAQDAVALTDLKLADLFDEPEIYLARGAHVFKLLRVVEGKEVEYVLPDGAPHFDAADLAFGRGRARPALAMRLHIGDRVALTEEELSAPIHRDVLSLRDAEGFDRMAPVLLTDTAMVANLTYGETVVKAVLTTEGASVKLGCLAENKETRAKIKKQKEENAARRRALSAIRNAVTSIVADGIRFDRPLEEKGPDRDGHLRPLWMTAYLQGRTAFEVDGRGYPVYDTLNRAWPPEVCVDFVLDSFERAAGTWFLPKGEKPGKTVGRFAWVSDVRELRGVIGFGERAEKHPELFDVRRFKGNERVPFGERERFFKVLATNANDIQEGDVLAIHGLKRDDRIHQHAIFVERKDPVTGFPFGLADQMKRPRRRTWEGVMAEAPKRSLLYRVHPKDVVFQSIDPSPNGSGVAIK